ncbi:MAG: hypothetical protein KF833_22550 [Verrucomicrobiae bacterium]|nr:hypothetical protein [Verrucomicrobiae bacterium]
MDPESAPPPVPQPRPTSRQDLTWLLIFLPALLTMLIAAVARNQGPSSSSHLAWTLIIAPVASLLVGGFLGFRWGARIGGTTATRVIVTFLFMLVAVVVCLATCFAGCAAILA